jgi:hypothetical protein
MNNQFKYLNKRFTNNDGHSGFVLRYVNAKEVYLKFDATGWVGCFSMGNIREGRFKDKMHPSVFGVGFIGDGEYKTGKNGKNNKPYKTWCNMLNRCYDRKTQEKQPAYKGCTVAKEWLNYQNFAKWYEENYPKDGKDYQLDKDKLVQGNKVYSPDTCCFLTQRENKEISRAKTHRFTSPDGEKVDVYNLRKFCKENNLNQGNMFSVAKGNRNQHKGWKLCQY